MRPVNRGGIPQVNGVNVTVADYKNWRQYLLDRIGNYCCYCNMVLYDSPQVEHVSPKNPQEGYVAGNMTAWENMLLACGPCNRAKSNKPNNTLTHYLPDYHNTHLAFDYIVIDHPKKNNTKACILIVNNTVNEVKATNTIDLCQLNNLKSNKKVTDLRWKYRFEAWYSANVVWRKEWDEWGFTRAEEFSRLLVNAATGKGFFSVWFQAFNDVLIVKETLLQSFLGTNLESFDANRNYQPVIRVAGDL